MHKYAMPGACMRLLARAPALPAHAACPCRGVWPRLTISWHCPQCQPSTGQQLPAPSLRKIPPFPIAQNIPRRAAFPRASALAVPSRHTWQKMFKFYNSLKNRLSPVDSAVCACYNIPSDYPVVCATPVLLPTDSKKDSGSVSVDAMPPIVDRPGKAVNGRRSPPCLSGG